MSEIKPKKKLLVCDVEGTIFKAEFKITGTDYASTMWQPLAHKLDVFNAEHGIEYPKTTEQEEKESNEEWEKGQNGKYEGHYLLWVEDTVRIHREHGMNKTVFDSVLESADYQNGVREFFRNLDTERFIPVLISGGFQELAERAQRELTDRNGNAVISHSFTACRYIWDDDGKLVSVNIQPTDFKNKYAYLKLLFEQYGLNETSDWIFIGDGKNDADIASRAPVSFAINPHPELAAVADYTIDSFMDINGLLESDEISRALSKKRGLSNKQAVLVGQRLLNSGKMKLTSYTEHFKADEPKVKFRLNVEVEDEGSTFDKIFDKIVKWCETYADDNERFKQEIKTRRSSKRFEYSYSGLAKIKIACINDESRMLGVEIHSQDTGTELRQAVLGAKTEIRIGIESTNASNRLTMKVCVLTRTPQNSFIKKNNILLESYCPYFVKELCDEGIKIYLDGSMQLSKNLDNIEEQDIAAVMGKESRTVAVIFLHEDFNKDDERTGLRQLADNLFGFAKIYCCKGSAFNALAEPQEQEIGAVISFPNNPPVILSKQSIERPASDAISYSQNTRRLYTKADGCITSAINITDFVITEYKNLLEGTAPDIEKSYYRQISDRIWELKNIAAMQLERKKSIEEMVEDSRNQIGISDDAINRIETMEKEVEHNSGINYTYYKPLLSGVRKFLEKGRLLLLLHNEINSDSKDEKYPMSLLQPIACAFEICVNLLLYRLEGENYYIIKQTENECGKILKYMRKYHWRKVERIDDILRKARLCRNDSSHPNIMLPLHDIDGSEKAKLYRAIEEISKLL